MKLYVVFSIDEMEKCEAILACLEEYYWAFAINEIVVRELKELYFMWQEDQLFFHVLKFC